MRIEDFDWEKANRSHLARHQVTPEEVEEVFINPLHLRRSHSGRYLAYGKTAEGRFLLVVFELRGKTVLSDCTGYDSQREAFVSEEG